MIHDCSLQLKACEIGPNFLINYTRQKFQGFCLLELGMQTEYELDSLLACYFVKR